MVFLYSIISGFRAILGSVAIQFAMAACLLFFVKVPTRSYEVEPYDGADESLQSQLQTLYILMLATHLFCSLSICGSQFASDKQFIAVQVVMIFAMMCQVMNITSVCSFMFLETQTGL